ncbi:triose or hexose phosphate/phosphate translocator, putative [Babesia caballi]|uniref:Triose or hexose phosphate/phosphate translocator, putative n=1 Tax=Babesia caballi TaxID=5871 RepID=A0AAV4LZS6_BABCB|nr:triose or hexose phosphate/phosphate translocator, putative [Babesia caballi]
MTTAAPETLSSFPMDKFATASQQLPVRMNTSEKVKTYLSNVNWMLIFGVTMWYAVNCTYVVQQKIFLNAVPLHWTLSGCQMIVGAFFCIGCWLTRWRPMPKFTNVKKAMIVFIPLGFCHLVVHYGAVISMGFGAVSFTQVIKSGEPVVTAVLSMIFLREFMSVWAYMALSVVVVGVGLSSFKEMNFNIWAFAFAMISNFGSSTRSILAKVTMKKKDEIGENLTAPNIYMILTVVSAVFSVPLVLGTESYKWKSVWLASTANMTGSEKALLLFHACSSAVCYYIYNDFAFYCLGQMNQVTHSVTNTMKRVLVIVASIIIFRNPVTPLGYLGMCMAIVGALLYSLIKQGVFTRKSQPAEKSTSEQLKSAETV